MKPVKLNALLLAAALTPLALSGCASKPAPADASPSARAAQQSGDQEAAQDAPENQLVCKNVKVTGSRLGQRQCYSQKTWDTIAEQSRRAAEEAQRKSAIGQSLGGG